MPGQGTQQPTKRLKVTEASPLSEALKWVAVLCSSVIVILAFVLVLQRQGTINGLRDQVDMIQADRLHEQQIETCRHLFEADLYFASAAYAQAEGSLVVALAANDDPRRDSALDALERRTHELNDAVAELQHYVASPDPAGRCSHPLSQEIPPNHNNE